MTQYKLSYFNFRGRAELIRFVFAAADQKYEDFRFEREEWPKYKSDSPTGQSPFLEVTENGSKYVLAQSISIARFLARRLNLAGSGDREQAEVDMYADQVQDLFNEMGKVYRETDETRKKELEAKLKSETVPQQLAIFETRVSKTGSGFLASSGLTYADLFLSIVLAFLGENKNALLAHFPHLKKLDESVTSHPRIAAWIAKRPVTPF